MVKQIKKTADQALTLVKEEFGKFLDVYEDVSVIYFSTKDHYSVMVPFFELDASYDARTRPLGTEINGVLGNPHEKGLL